MEKERQKKEKRPVDVAVGAAISRRRSKMRNSEGKAMSRQNLADEMVKRGYDHWAQNTVVRVEDGTQSLKIGEALAVSRILRADSLDALINEDGKQRAREAAEDGRLKRMKLAVSIAEFVQAQDEVRSASGASESSSSHVNGEYTLEDEILMPVEEIVRTVLRTIRERKMLQDGPPNLDSIDWKAASKAWARARRRG